MLIVSDSWRRRTLKSILLWTLVSVGATQSILGISQVFRGSDFGIRVLGEQQLSIHATGVAKVDVPAGTSGEAGLTRSSVPTGTIEKTLRAYGTLPHPNVLGGVLLACLTALTGTVLSKNSFKKLFLAHIALGITLIGLIGTFSRSAWISTILIVPGLLFCSHRNISSKLMKQLIFIIFIYLILLIVPSNKIKDAVSARIVPVGTDQFIQTRIDSFRDFSTVIRGRYLLGAGTGTGFIETFRNIRNVDKSKNSNHSNVHREYWQYQYPHSVPVVIVLEIGLVGLALVIGLVLCIARLIHVHYVNRLVPLRRLGYALLTLGVLVPLLTDHYLWTSQQGRVLFWGVLGTLLGLATASPHEDPLPLKPISGNG